VKQRRGRGIDARAEARSSELPPLAFVTSEGVAVRAATPDDLDVVVELRIALLREHAANPIYGRLRPDAPERARSLFGAQLLAPHETTFLAFVAGRAVGVLRCVHSGGSPLLFPAEYCYVSSVYVRPEARRSGVLRALMRAAEEWSDDRDLDEIRLHSASDTPLSNAAWDGLGFEVVEHLRVRAVRPAGRESPGR
jgi:ribosomal protein S18 acetylase RimI-like enzyme